MTDFTTKEGWDGLVNLDKERYNTMYSWHRNIILLASSLLGIIVSLHSKKADCKIEILTYSLAIGLLGLGILTGAIFLYSEVAMKNSARKGYAEQLIKQTRGEFPNGPISFAEVSNIYSIMRRVSNVSFLLAIIFLVIYSCITA